MGEFQLMGFCVVWSGMRVCIGGVWNWDSHLSILTLLGL